MRTLNASARLNVLHVLGFVCCVRILTRWCCVSTAPQNFSSVVGPNGSGKSNVIDAMLFVFGFKAKKVRVA